MSEFRAFDSLGQEIRVGDKVRVVTLDPATFPWLEGEALEKVLSFVGDVLIVEEIDEHGQAWVMKEWEVSEGRHEMDKIGLESHEYVFESCPMA